MTENISNDLFKMIEDKLGNIDKMIEVVPKIIENQSKFKLDLVLIKKIVIVILAGVGINFLLNLKNEREKQKEN